MLRQIQNNRTSTALFTNRAPQPHSSGRGGSRGRFDSNRGRGQGCANSGRGSPLIAPK